MKSRRERMRKEEIQLTIRRIPLAMESNRLLPSERWVGEKERIKGRDRNRKKVERGQERYALPMHVQHRHKTGTGYFLAVSKGVCV